jgi:hypothetical protein
MMSGKRTTEIVQNSNNSKLLSLKLVIGPYIAYENEAIRVTDP